MSGEVMILHLDLVTSSLQEQFMFIHKALIDALSTKEFKITASQVVKRSRNKTLLSEEFQVCI